MLRINEQEFQQFSRYIQATYGIYFKPEKNLLSKVAWAPCFPRWA